ncbi:hypothetical protein ACIBG8_21590 [Nonomuraea sp. NPDC050556]|uniref:hypothetical protein n=1 Tax=Nonomuraea sp. NPDC050556 TaxID=3364369 RepID=UPI0037BD719D
MTLVGKPGLLKEHSILGRLLLLGHVGATETFFRTVLAGLVNLCPLCKEHASSQVVPFGSIHYYESEDVALGLFDGTSLAGASEIKRVVKKVTDIDLAQTGPLKTALEKYDALCHLRHAAVHAHGNIGTGNAVALGLPSAGSRFTLNIDLARVHEAAMICRTVTQEVNQYLFQETFKRWRNVGLFVRDYEADRQRFVDLYSLFRSMRDTSSRSMTPKKAYGKLFA